MTDDLNVRIVRAQWFQGDRHWHAQGAVRPYSTVYFVAGGNGHIRLNGVTTDMLSGYVYLIPPFLRHDVWCDTHVEQVHVDVHMELLPGSDCLWEKTVLSRAVGVERCHRMRTLCGGGIRERLLLRSELESVMADLIVADPQSISAKHIRQDSGLSSCHCLYAAAYVRPPVQG